MALSERSRSALFQGLTSVIDDEEAVSEMLSQFPARDVDDYITVAEFRAEMAEFRGEMRAEMAAFQKEMRAEMTAFREEMRAEMAAFREEMRVEMQREFRRMMTWTFSLMLTMFTAMVAVLALIR